MKIDFVKLYEKLGVKIKYVNGAQATAHCPFHNDTNASFSFETESGLWKCFAGDGEGNIYHFLAKRYGVCISDAEDLLKGILDPIQDDYMQHHHNLMANKKVLEVFLARRGLTIETLKYYKIGYDGDRFTIPIFIGDILINIRKYSLEAGRAKMTNVPGHGSIKLYPYDNVLKKDRPLYIYEGEMDCLLANQLGFNAVTVTSGAGAWRKEWGYVLRDRDIVICYDIDNAGQKGAETVTRNLKEFARSIKVIKLPIVEPKNGDFSNYILDYNHTAEDFKRLVDSVSVSEFPSTAGEAEVTVSEEIYETALNNSSDEKYYFKKIKLPVVISGKDLTPFVVPQKVKYKCDNFSPNDREVRTRCLHCGLAKNNSETLVFDEKSQTALKMIYSSDTQLKGILREAAKIPENCSKWKYEITQVQNVEECRLIPEVDYCASDSNSEYVARNAYYLGAGIKTNASYLITGVAMPNPRNQYATIVFSKAEPKRATVDKFCVTEDIISRLKIFQPKENQSVEAKLDEIYEDLTYNVTKIYHREDLLVALDLSFFSVLEFDFLGEHIKKGYVEVLVIGDTRCGKTKSVQSIIEHYRAGEFITGENSSFSGLVGGMNQVGQKWLISWGKLPLNDRKLVVIDEASSLPEETISNLSGIRSSGVAEIVKIQTERTRARCRIIWLSNPRSGKKLNSYNHGVLAVKELIGKVEDIARFDLAITVASDDVDLSKIQEETNKKVIHTYTSTLHHELILWAWSRKKENIIFAPDAISSILEYSNDLAKNYSSTIPLVEPAEQRIKLARLSAAIGARLFSTDESGENLIITSEHVSFVYNFLKLVYNKKSMAYNIFSENQFLKTQISNNEKEQIIAEFKNDFASWDIIRDVLLDNQYFRKTEFLDQTGMDKEEGKSFFRWATKRRLIRSTTGGYRKNPIFTEILKEIIKDTNDNSNGKEMF